MALNKIYENEYQLCLILWKNEPITASELASLSYEKLGWARTTTYTVIDRLSKKGVLKREGHIVTMCLTKEYVQDARTEELLQKTFGGHFADLIASLARLFSKHFPEDM